MCTALRPSLSNSLRPSSFARSFFYASMSVLIGHYERGGEIKTVDDALDSPSELEFARRERIKREG